MVEKSFYCNIVLFNCRSIIINNIFPVISMIVLIKFFTSGMLLDASLSFCILEAKLSSADSPSKLSATILLIKSGRSRATLIATKAPLLVPIKLGLV